MPGSLALRVPDTDVTSTFVPPPVPTYYTALVWQQVLGRERTLTGEKLTERLDEQQYEREREAYQRYLAEKDNGGER